MNKRCFANTTTLTFFSVFLTTAGANELSTTTAEQTNLHVTIYNSNIALVKDYRELTLPTGINTLAFKDVSAGIQPETAILSAQGVTLLEQNFEYDLLTPQSLLNKFVGKTVTLERYDGKDNLISEQAEVLANNNGAVLKVGEQIRTNQGLNNLVFDDVPDDLRDKPTLTMLIDNQQAEKQTLSLSYLTNNLNWKADYVISLHDEESLDLKGWVTLNNHSGTSYNNAKLQLVAGEVNRVQAPRYGKALQMEYMPKPAMVADNALQEESLFEYHLYSLARPTTIKTNQQKQVSLLEAIKVPYTKQLLINAYDPHGWQAWNDSAYQDLKTEAKILIDNKKAANLGMPLPAGIVRTYQKDSNDNAQFIGEDRIKHTPINESMTLKLGEAFDVTAKRKQTNYNSERKAKQNAVSKIKQTIVTASYEIILKNAKDSDVTVDYQEYFNGNWTVKKQSLVSERLSSTLNRWKVNIPAKGKTTLTYTVEMVF